MAQRDRRFRAGGQHEARRGMGVRGWQHRRGELRRRIPRVRWVRETEGWQVERPVRQRESTAARRRKESALATWTHVLDLPGGMEHQGNDAVLSVERLAGLESP